jgi:peptidyl-prolyl cis-trans isomerase A (cyclophilin A)
MSNQDDLLDDGEKEMERIEITADADDEISESEDVESILDDANFSSGDGGGHNDDKLHVEEHDDAEEHAVVRCYTSAGIIVMNFHRAWSPNGYDRATLLFERGYYDESHFFRVVPHFLVQFGISYTTDSELKHLADANIPDDPKREDLMPFKEGYMSFAGSGPNSRTSQLFIAYDGAGGLGQSPWETPFGEVVEGMDNVRNLYSYGDMPPWGEGPQQGPIRNQGAKYIEEGFPLLDKFNKCNVLRTGASTHDEGGGVVEDHRANKIPAAAEQKRIRGGGMMTNDAQKLKVKQAQRELKNDPNVVETQQPFPLYGKFIIVVAVLSLILSRRKKSKESGKAN